jgi:hypothetical protein
MLGSSATSSDTIPALAKPSKPASKSAFVATAARKSLRDPARFALDSSTPSVASAAVILATDIKKTTFPRPSGPSAREVIRTLNSDSSEAPTLVE